MTAAETRQPKGLLSPKIAMPAAIIHLPSGGCTTYSGESGRIPEGCPATKEAFASFVQLSS